MSMDQYLSMFIDESKEHLQHLNDNLMALEQDSGNLAIVQEIFRSAHTLKGMAGSMGFEDMAGLTHKMENVLDLVRNDQLKMNDAIFEALFKSLDMLEFMVDDVISGGTGKADTTEVMSLLESSESGEQAGTAEHSAASESEAAAELDIFQYSVLKQSLEGGFHAFFAKVTIREDCLLKAARAYLVFDYLERNGEVVKSTPSVQDIEQERFDRIFTVYYISKLGRDELEREIRNISEIESTEFSPIREAELSELHKLQQQRIDEDNRNTAKAETAAAGAVKAAPSPARAQVQAGKTIRVDIERLDGLMNLFSELLIDRVRLESLAGELRKTELTETVEHMARVSSDLQNIVLKLRMVPVDTVFNRFPRMMRDLAKNLNKMVNFVITGADTELDRTVVDEIGDPLVHMLRNSLDHGLETPAERKAAGKSETGTIELRAYHSGNHVFIEIEDDGKGINREKVLQVAIRNGVVTAEEGQKMTDNEVDQLLFASGFSTADKISDISGRGVGLDVVKTKIASLGGNVTVESRQGQGSKFSIQLPLTLSIIAAMLVRVGPENYAIPLSSIVETMLMKPEQIRSVQKNAVVDYRGGIVPIVNLGKLFEVPEYSVEGRGELEIVIVKKGEKLAALIVDELLGQQEIVLKTLGKYLTNLFAISGATILGDGRVALIVDPNGIIK